MSVSRLHIDLKMKQVEDEDQLNRLVAMLGSSLLFCPQVGPHTLVRHILYLPDQQELLCAMQYGCSRGVVGTPTYLVNGVTVGGADESWSVNEWAKVFDPLVKSPGFILES